MAYRTSEIAPGIWAIDEGMVQCFLIEGRERALLIDSCVSGGADFTQTVRSLTDKPIMLVITHSDFDHTAGQADFLPAYMHPAEFARYAAKGNDMSQVRPIWANDTIELGGVTLQVMLLPGHTPGSIALLDRDNRRLFIGDTISDAMIYLFGEGRSVPAFIASLKRLKHLLSGSGLAGLEEQLGQEALGRLAQQAQDDEREYIVDVLHSAHGSFELPPEWITRTLEAAEKLLAGELEGKEPAEDLPCKRYSYQGVNMLY